MEDFSSLYFKQLEDRCMGPAEGTWVSSTVSTTVHPLSDLAPLTSYTVGSLSYLETAYLGFWLVRFPEELTRQVLVGCTRVPAAIVDLKL